MKKFITNKSTQIFLGVLLFLSLWTIMSEVIDEKTMILPSPYQTVIATIDCLKSAYVYKCLGITFLKMLAGFGIALLLALVFGILAGNISFIDNMLYPFLSVLKSIPSASLIFLFLVLAGSKNVPIIMVVIIAFPILYESITRGIHNIDKNIIYASRVDGAKWYKKIIRIELPSLFPYLMVGMASSFSLSFKIEIMSEIISGDTKAGLGSAILFAKINNIADMRPIFAYSLIAVIFIFIVSLLLRVLENKFKNFIV